jgi:hypothetical protein
MMTPGAKRLSTPRKARRIVPSAERRLRTSFPELWAWYELLVTARGATPSEEALDAAEDSPRKTSARR